MFQKMKNNSKKIVSLILSLSMVISSFGASTNNFVRASAGQDSASARFVKYTKDHPVITQLGIVGVCAAAMGIVFGGIKLSHMYTLKDVTTVADGWNDAKLESELSSEIDKFNKNGEIEGKGSIFKVDESARKLISKKVLYLFLRRINIIMGEYPNIIAKYKRRLSAKGKNFVIKAEQYRQAPGGGEGAAYTNCGEGQFVICARPLKNLESFYLDFLKDMNSGFHPPCDPDKFIESLAAHEMGHIIQYALAFTDDGENTLSKYSEKEDYEGAFQSALDRYLKDKFGEDYQPVPGTPLLYGRSDQKLNVFASSMKNLISKQCGGEAKISGYGETNVLDWFAEGVACLSCCSDEIMDSETKKLVDEVKKFLGAKEKQLATVS